MPNRKSLGGRVLFWFMGFLDFRPLLLGSKNSDKTWSGSVWCVVEKLRVLHDRRRMNGGERKGDKEGKRMRMEEERKGNIYYENYYNS